MKKLLFGLLGLLVTISGWSAETNSGPISSVTVAGLVEQNGTPSPATPVAISTNNGVLKVSKNLFNKNGTLLNGTYNYNNGSWISNASFRTQDNIPAKPNVHYTVSVDNLKNGSSAFSLQAWDSNHQWLGAVAATATGSGSQTVITGTTPENTAFISVSFAPEYKDIDTLQVEIGSTATEYKPYGQIYTDGEVETIGDSANHTATVATLLGVGDYRDTQNINTGAITRNVGVKVLDGTENWTYASASTYFALSGIGAKSGEIYKILNSHYRSYSSNTGVADMPNNSTKINRNNAQLFIKTTDYDSLTNWKQFLTDQYNAGTPVIIIYPLATPTTESVAGQTMTTAPVNNRTGGVTGMTITTLLSSGASVVTTIATNAIKIATTAYNSARFSPVVTELNTTIATIRDVVTNTINQTKAIADLQATKQTRPDENCPAGKKCLLVEDNDGTPHWYEIIENAD